MAYILSEHRMNLPLLAPHDDAPPAGPAPAEQARRWVPIRTLQERHRSRILAHLLALDADDRLLRFGHVVSDERIRQYAAQLDFERDQFFGSFDRRLALLTLGHLALDLTDGSAEFAVSVLARARGRGLGSQLFEHAVTHARNRGVHTLYLQVARENAPMLAIARRAGAVIDFDGHDAVATLPLPGDTLGTQIEEMLGHQAGEIDYRAKRHALRLDLHPATSPTSAQG